MDQTANAAAGVATGDLSILSLFLQADIVVKIVMVLLLLASVWVWAIIFEKVISLRRVNRQADAFEDRFWSGGSLEELFDAEGTKPAHPVGRRVRRRHGRVAPLRPGGRGRHVPRRRAGPGGPRHDGHGRARDGADGALDGVPRLGRFHRAVHRPVRHGVGHHPLVLGNRGEQEHQPGGGRPPVSPRRCSPPPSAWWRPSRAVLAYNKISTDLSRFAARLEGFGTEFGAILSRQSEERA